MKKKHELGTIIGCMILVLGAFYLYRCKCDRQKKAFISNCHIKNIIHNEDDITLSIDLDAHKVPLCKFASFWSLYTKQNNNTHEDSLKEAFITKVHSLAEKMKYKLSTQSKEYVRQRLVTTMPSIMWGYAKLKSLYMKKKHLKCKYKENKIAENMHHNKEWKSIAFWENSDKGKSTSYYECEYQKACTKYQQHLHMMYEMFAYLASVAAFL